MRKRGITRREFLAGAGAAGGLLLIGDRLIKVKTRAAPGAVQDGLRVAVVGLGQQGQILLRSFMKVPGVEIAALCDVDEVALRRARAFVTAPRGQGQPRLHSDVRYILDDPRIDAVAIATPNHWHALMGIWACQAGKHCYIESPCSHSFFEGRQLLAAVRKYGSIVQYGSLGLSDRSGFDATDIACLEPLQSVRTVCFPNKVLRSNAPPSFKRARAFDLWLGPAHFEQPRQIKPDWRKNPPMHNGALGFFAHDDLHQNMQLLGAELPVRVSTLSAGKSASVTRGACIAMRMEFGGNSHRQAKRLELEVLPKNAMPRKLRVFLAAQGGDQTTRTAPRVVSETTIRGAGGALTAISVQNLVSESDYLVRNFVEAVREHKPQLLASPIEQAHITCGSLHLANISLALKRPLTFDPTRQVAVNDARADELLLGFHRTPYTLPERI
jgi:predicted dehydrogenase